MNYLVKHYEGGYQVFEQDGDSEKLIASFHKDPETSTGKKTLPSCAPKSIAIFSIIKGWKGTSCWASTVIRDRAYLEFGLNTRCKLKPVCRHRRI